MKCNRNYFVPISSLLFYLLFIENWIISFPVCEYNKSEKAYLGFREDREFILSARKLSPTLILLLKFALLSQLKIVIGSERDLVVSCVSDTILCHVLNMPFYSFFCNLLLIRVILTPVKGISKLL